MYASRHLPLTLKAKHSISALESFPTMTLRKVAQFNTICAAKLSVQILGWSKLDTAVRTARFYIRRAMPKSSPQLEWQKRWLLPLQL
jgi:hypothetical protein